ncbi:DISARM system SNF2-like helicase DrmD [Actinoalloteichus sp. GBA129-24]|uniref:DISARM system SNF2-like helicase DrmD n=1 Tax=Actinoalloteichus sp. GBA129-24 TaxID=1612551 RepID=UPI0009505C67|nr:DISARM system SNF2-like helicase DrmD [Actinoalloteichus sp. GBA129-24]APU22205.1 DNA/RNA helicase, superfamily II, SNF2 family [Actinoalloteichus sp. GBA129-24]
MSSSTTDQPVLNALVSVRGQKWVVSAIEPGGRHTLTTLQSVEDGRFGDTLEVIWEIEPGRRTLPSGVLPEVARHGFDEPGRLAAFLDAVRWSAITSAEVKTLQAPFRSGVAIEDYQLEPVARAIGAPRVNLLLADDVGLGKTVEAGLVVQELLLRHRGHRVLIVCPAGLTLKWQDEMAAKFGLDFTIIDSERCAEVRRTYGSSANPFEVFPKAIVSLPWLRTAKAQRLLDEILPPDGPTYPRTFDLLILDEAHHVAPAAPKQVYAVDSQQTKLIRRLAPHFTHRLFLSATPHNGYQASFTALLEILDDQRFLRGFEPDRAAVKDTVIRRLKRQIRNPDGTPRFPERHTGAIPVHYPDDEREIHALLVEFATLRKKKLVTRRGKRATDLVTLLLKKRLFSSPSAFAHTVGVYLNTLRSRSAPVDVDLDLDEPEWLDDYEDSIDAYDDEQLAQAEDDILDRTRPLQPDPSTQETDLLERMHRWAREHEASPDAKARELVNYLRSVCRPDEHWTNERVVVFTEYRDTQLWLAALLRQEGLGDDRLELLHGGMATADRERLREAFQKAPTEYPVRILLATDAASEGIDLHRHCHRLVNYDIPFNPNKLEQRIGRIDRYGQTETPDVRHFVGTGFGREVDAFEADLEFLSRVATKVSAMQADLGTVNAVLADAVQNKMLGRHVVIDVDHAGEGTARGQERLSATETDLGEQIARLRSNLDATVESMGITPASVRRVVDTALELSRERPLRPVRDELHHADGLFEVPVLGGSWSRATAGLTERFPKPDSEPRQLPITFDQAVAKGRDDVVLAHLNHPLVSMSTELLRAAVSNEDIGLSRVTAVVSDDPAMEEVLVGAYSRFVLVGGDGVRLHEEVLFAGGWLPAGGRFRRVESLSRLRNHLSTALDGGRRASGVVEDRLRHRWDAKARDALLASVDARAATRRESLERILGERREAEQRRIVTNLDQFAHSLRKALSAEDEPEDGTLFSEADIKSPDELAQYRRDRQAGEDRLQRLTDERDRELALVEQRYRDPRPQLFPVAVVFVVPKREATR